MSKGKELLENLQFKLLTEDIEDIYIVEKLITFGKKVYPKFGNVVIMTGGAASGKGFIIDNLVGIEGFKFDTDQLKQLLLLSSKIRQHILREKGIDISNLVQSNLDYVSTLHSLVKEYGYDKHKLYKLYKSISLRPKDRKPNLIFDVTLSEITKLDTITHDVKEIGYDLKNIHIVWVVNDLEVALSQNASRERNVKKEVVISTHQGVSNTIRTLLDIGDSLKQYMDGDIIFAFNKIKVDTHITTSDTIKGKGVEGFKSRSGLGKYIDKADYIYVKHAGKPQLTVDQISMSIRQKLQSYTPQKNWV